MSSSSSSTVTAQGLPTVLSDLPPIFTALYQSKVTKKLSFEQIASAIGRNEWYTAAIFYGQAKPDKDDLDKLSKALDVPREELETNLGEHFYPNRGVGEWPPKDPVVYRLYEALLVYAHPLKAIIHEKFGDGIMSAIDFYGDVEKVPDPKGDRVKITFNGKFLPYKRW
ncbi:putative cyanate hydratase [Acaromyces ingoldii]|uniref:Cyanate hydratase n=1 Tax=Acaromyces ingoldii TaxID=215250 RepID=A0A316YMI9_9BASI|nr:putative cyanate hydratase [Acaromyces ingoldii]PWN88955.1 putative cyanate hydratase [Acaromyces ingoldii]